MDGVAGATKGDSMNTKMAIGADFDRLNDMAAYSRLQDLAQLAGGFWNDDLSSRAIGLAIESRSHFIMEVW